MSKVFFIADTHSELWKPVVGYENEYEVSNFGNVRSLDRTKVNSKGVSKKLKGKMLSVHVSKRGYYTVTLGGKKRTIHRLIAEAFIPNPNLKPQINHIDGDKLNNTILLDNDSNIIGGNLEWVTDKENLQHAWNTGLRPSVHKRGADWVNSRQVGQYDLNDNLIKIWNGTTEIKRELGIQDSNIRKCCYGERNTAGGFKWRYLTDAKW